MSLLLCRQVDRIDRAHALQSNLTPSLLCHHHHGVHVSSGAGCAAVRQECTSSHRAACSQEGTEVRAGHEAELLNSTDLALMHRLLGTVLDHGSEASEVADVSFQVGVDEHQVSRVNGAGTEVGASRQLLSHAHGVSRLELTSGLTQLVQAHSCSHSVTGGTVGVHHVGTTADHTVRDQLFDGGHVLANQLGHVAGDVILVHRLSFAGDLHQHAELLQGDLHVLVLNGASAGRHAFLQQVVADGDVRGAVGAGINRHSATEHDCISLVLGHLLLSTEGAQHFDGFGVLEHFTLGHDEVPARNQ